MRQCAHTVPERDWRGKKTSKYARCPKEALTGNAACEDHSSNMSPAMAAEAEARRRLAKVKAGGETISGEELKRRIAERRASDNQGGPKA